MKSFKIISRGDILSVDIDGETIYYLVVGIENKKELINVYDLSCFNYFKFNANVWKHLEYHTHIDL